MQKLNPNGNMFLTNHVDNLGWKMPGPAQHSWCTGRRPWSNLGQIWDQKSGDGSRKNSQIDFLLIWLKMIPRHRGTFGTINWSVRIFLTENFFVNLCAWVSVFPKFEEFWKFESTPILSIRSQGKLTLWNALYDPAQDRCCQTTEWWWFPRILSKPWFQQHSRPTFCMAGDYYVNSLGQNCHLKSCGTSLFDPSTTIARF